MSAIRIGFAGLSHLGLVYGITMASRGHEMVGYDLDAQRVTDLNAGHLPVFEPGLDKLFQESRSRLRFESNPSALSSCDVVFISIDVRTDSENRSDHSQIRALIAEILGVLPPQVPLVILSQVPPGFTRPLAAGRSNVFYQVETLVFGRAVERAVEPERYILGCADPQSPLPAAYHNLLHSYGCPVLPMRFESAELAKIAINMYLVSSVSTTNVLAQICEGTGAHWGEIAPALRLDRRIGQHAYLTPGLGIAGGNLERDLVTIQNLGAQHGTEYSTVDSWLRNSSYRKLWALRRLHDTCLGRPEGKGGTVALWGLAYKQDTHSIKNSPAMEFARALCGVPLQAYDPKAELTPADLASLGDNFRRCPELWAACEGASALVILTPWAEFAKADAQRLKKTLRVPLVIDPFGMLPAERCAQAGLQHHQLGVGSV